MTGQGEEGNEEEHSTSSQDLPPNHQSHDGPSGDKDNESFIVRWGANDPQNPKSYSKPRKYFITLLVASGAACATCGSSIYVSAYDQLEAHFGISQEVVTLGLSLYVLGLALGPLWLGPISEEYGRNPVYLSSFALFAIWQLPSALAPNVASLMISRFLAGFCSSGFLSNAAGSVSDMFERQDLNRPMAYFTASPLVGPCIGPLIGDFICYNTDWRWIFWVMLIWIVVCLALYVVALPETYTPVLLARKAARKRKESGDSRYRAQGEHDKKNLVLAVMTSCTRPFMLMLEPMVLVLNIFISFQLGIIYLFFPAFTLVFGNNHDFKLWQIGLSFIGLGVGVLLSIPFEMVWTPFMRRREKKRMAAGQGGLPPESKLITLIIGQTISLVGLFWFAFTSYRRVHWIVPIIGSAPFSFGFALNFQSVFAYLVSSYPQYAASVIAGNTFLRCCFGAGFPLFAVQMYTRLGYDWATALLGFLSLLLYPFPVLFYYYGDRLRRMSKIAVS